jgi:hypothetical protein
LIVVRRAATVEARGQVFDFGVFEEEKLNLIKQERIN